MSIFFLRFYDSRNCRPSSVPKWVSQFDTIPELNHGMADASRSAKTPLNLSPTFEVPFITPPKFRFFSMFGHRIAFILVRNGAESMTEPKTSVNRVIRELYEIPISRHAWPLPVLQLAPELDQLTFDSKKIKLVFDALLETLSLFRETQPMILQSAVVGAPTLRRFGSSTDGSFLTISLGSKSLPIGCIDHTPGSEFTDLPTLNHLSKIINELGGTLLLTDIGGKLRRLRCILPMPNQEHPDGKYGREKILLVEDEEFVRNVTREVLELSGYTVLEAIDAESGIRIFQEHAKSIDLLLTDVVMPGMNGRDLATRLFGISPALKAIFMSGYTENAITRQGFADPRLVYLQKPFTLDVLTRKVREVLDLPTRVEAPPNYIPGAAHDLAHTQI